MMFRILYSVHISIVLNVHSIRSENICAVVIKSSVISLLESLWMTTSSMRIEVLLFAYQFNRFEWKSHEIVGILAIHYMIPKIPIDAIKCFCTQHGITIVHCSITATTMTHFLLRSILSISFTHLFFSSHSLFVDDHHFTFWFVAALSLRQIHFMTKNRRFISIEPFCLYSFYRSNFFASKIEVSSGVSKKNHKKT